MAETASSTGYRPHRGCGFWAGASFLTLILVAGAVLWKFADKADGWLSVLRPRHSISERFRQSVTVISANQGDILEVAAVQSDETVTRDDKMTWWNDRISLGTTVSEIRVPVVYRYHIRLSDDWEWRVAGGHGIVRVPAIRPSLPPAIRTEGMEKRSEAGWLRFNSAENLAALEKSLTATLEGRAGDAQHLGLAREAARQSVAKFVRQWVLKEGKVGGVTGGLRSLTVIFPDEVDADPAALPALPLP